ncbi:MAG: sigma-70 family RNA polymerase sigma factor [Chitinivibrionales bacterium]|nr:sigma-70 family RNA polymerase sigma factor [Chitinivibrionales bacterium]
MRRDNHKIEDRELLWKACHEGCGQSLSAIYVRYRKPVCDYLRKIRADGLAEDICQDVFGRICEKRCDYNGRSNVKDYLFGIASNILHNHQRTKKEKNFPSDQLESLAGELRISTIPSAESILETEDRFQEIQKSFLLLPPKSRQAIEIWLQEGDCYPTIPCDANTFGMRLSYAIRCLRKKMMGP